MSTGRQQTSPRPLGPRWPGRATRTALGALAILAVTTLASAPSEAQYRPAGGGIQQPPDRKSQLEGAISDARFRLGPFRVAPWLGVRNASYQKNLLGSEQGDWTATAGAGLRLYMPLGNKAVIATHALPEYVYWHRQDERRRAMGHYGAGLFVFLNRLELEATARRIEDLELASDDLLVRMPQTAEQLEVAGQLRLAGSIALFAGVREHQARLLPFEDQELEELTRAFGHNRRAGRVGLRYLLPASRGHFGLGGEVEETTFIDDSRGRSNEGKGLYGEINLRGNRLDLFFDGSHRSLEPTAGSSFPGVEVTTGQISAQLRIGWRLTPNVYYRRSLSYPVLDQGPYLIEDRLGLRLGVALRFVRDVNLQLFYELGELDFADSGRVDDVTAYGVTTMVPVNRFIRMNLGARRTEYTSNMPGLDRGFDEVFANLHVGFGSGGPGDW